MEKHIITTNDTRTEAERRYDAERSGQLYVKPADDEEIQIACECDRIIAEQRGEHSDDGPATLHIERHTRPDDGSAVGDPWTSYELGQVAIDIQDSGRGSIIIDRESVSFDDSVALLDLHMLLTNETLLESIDPSRPRENTDLMIEVLTAIDGGEDENEGIDPRFDRVVDAVLASLPQRRKETHAPLAMACGPKSAHTMLLE